MNLIAESLTVPRNQLLSSMKAAAYERLRPCIETVDLQTDDLLGEAGDSPAYVYFPNTAVLSVRRRLDDGSFMEVASIGHEGVNALPIFLGASHMRNRSQVSTGGTATRMTLSDFITASKDDGLLNVALRRYAGSVLADVERAVVCMRFHSIAQQFVRWVLYTADRLGREEFALTHAAVAEVLGVRRASITEAVGALKRQGLIRSNRGRIAILDREKLQALSCVCYRPRNEG